MAVDIVAQTRLTGGGTLDDAALDVAQLAAIGGAILPALAHTWSLGTGSAQVNKWYLARRTLGATTYDDLNLTSGLSTMGVTQVFTALKYVLVAVVDPDGTKKLRVGPQGRTNANPLWFQAVTANFWEETFSYIEKPRPVTGWAVTAAATDVLSIYNPTGSSLDYAIWLMGVGP